MYNVYKCTQFLAYGWMCKDSQQNDSATFLAHGFFIPYTNFCMCFSTSPTCHS